MNLTQGKEVCRASLNSGDVCLGLEKVKHPVNTFFGVRGISCSGLFTSMYTGLL